MWLVKTIVLAIPNNPKSQPADLRGHKLIYT